ncbi:hypothetical protein KJ877_02795 [bacterium]|nr:hypothetical protein [bacterium]MBU1990163.1 hypothetical protein [bacterium]
MHKAYKISIIYFSLFVLLLLTSGYMIFELKIGFDAQRALSYYMGNEESFLAAKTNSGILKITLGHIFGFALLSMVVLHFLVFTKYRNKMFTKTLIYTILIAQFFEIFTPFLIINVSEVFIYLKIISFFVYMGLIPTVLYLLFDSIVQIKN